MAERVGATVQTVINWEKGRTEPEHQHLPAIISFLGYDPAPEPVSLAEQIRAARRRAGITQEELAKQLGVDQATVARWETGLVKKRFPRFTRLFEEYVRGGE